MTKGKLVKALVLWSAVIVGLVIAIVGVTMIRHGFSARKSPSRIETFVARSARSMAVPAREKRMKNPIPNTAENLAEARAHWADHCAICHANNGGGNTTIGQNLYPKAPDMRQPRTQNMTDGELYYTIQNGIRLSGMPAWGQAGENDEESEMERLNPKGPEERQEEQEEEQFLNGTNPAIRHSDHQRITITEEKL